MRIAIIGASADRDKYGNKAVRAYRDAGWEVFPINPNAAEIEGFKAYPSVKDVPGGVAVVSLYVPPQIGRRLVDEFAAAGVKSAYINPGSESDELIQALRDAGIRPLLQCSIVAAGKRPSDYK